MELIFKVSFLVLASLFTGIVLFLSVVLRVKVFNALTEQEYHSVYSKIIIAGRKSIIINVLVLVPILIFFVYLLYGFRDLLFIVGSLLYILGSFMSSRLISEPAYTQLLKLDINDYTKIIKIRGLINRGNITRTILSLSGILIVGVSIIQFMLNVYRVSSVVLNLLQSAV